MQASADEFQSIVEYVSSCIVLQLHNSLSIAEFNEGFACFLRVIVVLSCLGNTQFPRNAVLDLYLGT